MKILSLLQPWAELLVNGHKRIETRSWATHYRGPIFIHASGSLFKKFKGSDLTPKLISLQEPFNKFIDWETLNFGWIIGMVEIVTCIPSEDVMRFLNTEDNEYAFGDYSPNRYAWECANFTAFDLITPIKGQLGIRDIVNATRCPHCNTGHFPENKMHIIRDAKGAKLEVIVCKNMIL